MRDETVGLVMFVGGGLGSVAFFISNIYFNGVGWLYTSPSGVIIMLFVCVIGYLGVFLPRIHDAICRTEDGVWKASAGEPVPMSENERRDRLKQMKIPGI